MSEQDAWQAETILTELATRLQATGMQLTHLKADFRGDYRVIDLLDAAIGELRRHEMYARSYVSQPAPPLVPLPQVRPGVPVLPANPGDDTRRWAVGKGPMRRNRGHL